MPNLEILNVSYNTAEDLSCLGECENLKELYLSDFDEKKTQVISQMTWLNVLGLQGESEMEDLTCLQDLDRLYLLQVSDGFRSLKGVGELYSLGSLILDCPELSDLSELSEAKFVTNLDIRNCGITDYSVFSELPELKLLLCTQEQQEAILALDASPEFEIQCG